MYVFVAGLVIVEYANVCAEYLLDHKWGSCFSFGYSMLQHVWIQMLAETKLCFLGEHMTEQFQFPLGDHI